MSNHKHGINVSYGPSLKRHKCKGQTKITRHLFKLFQVSIKHIDFFSLESRLDAGEKLKAVAQCEPVFQPSWRRPCSRKVQRPACLASKRMAGARTAIVSVDKRTVC